MFLADVDVTTSIQRGLNEVVAFIPELIACLAIIIIGYFVAKALGRLVTRLLARAGFDGFLHQGQAGTWVQKVTSRPSGLVGTLTFWAVFLAAISWGVDVLGVSALSGFVAAVWAYLPNVVAAVLIFMVAGAVAAGVAALASRFLGDTSLGKIVSTAAPILGMTIATFMILDQLQIAENIVTITYAALLGAIALGSALAFGLGGRDVAREMLQGAYEQGRANKEQFKRDLDRGVSRAREEAQSMQDGQSTPPARTEV
jgi:hypothetical protein